MIRGKISLRELSPELASMIGSGGVVSISNTVTITQHTTSVAIGIPEYDQTKDIIFTFKNTTFLNKDTDYTVSTDNKNILCTDVAGWNTSAITMVFNFIIIKNAPPLNKQFAVAYDSKTEYVTLSADLSSVNFITSNITSYDPSYDKLSISKNNLELYEGPDYTISSDKTHINCITGTWSKGDLFKIELIQNKLKQLDIVEPTASNINFAAETSGLKSINVEAAIIELVNRIPVIKSGTFISGSNSYVVTDSNISVNDLVQVFPDSSQLGNWSVNSTTGSFTITSSITESASVPFKYYIIKGGN